MDGSAARTAPDHNAIERLNEEFRRRIQTQTVLPAPETVLLWTLMASGPIQMRKIDGRETLDHPLEPATLDEAA